jgi:drug/metabolite transporter (DMT)-like permease
MTLRQWGAFALLSLIWGASFMLIKVGLAAMPPLTLVAGRITSGAVALWIIIRWRGYSFPTAPAMLGALAIMGFFNNAVPFSLITWGETTIDSGLAAVLNSTVPLFTVIIAHLWLADERLTLRAVVGLLVGFLGVIEVVRAGASEFGVTMLGAGDLGGQLAVILASASYAAATVFARRYLRAVHPFVLATAQLTTGAIFMWLAVAIWEWPLAVDTGAPVSILAVLILGVVNTGVAYMLYFRLLSDVGATRTTLVTYVVPAVGLSLGFFVLDEPLTLTVILGFLLIVCGVMLVSHRPRRGHAQSMVRAAADAPPVVD